MKVMLILALITCFETAALTQTFVTIGKTQSPPVLDGHLNDVAWKHAIELTNFIRLTSPGTPAQRTTTVKITYDHAYLYVAFQCQEPLLHPVLNRLQDFKASCTRADDPGKLWQDDLVEIFLEPPSTKPDRYLHLAVNSKGIIYDTIAQMNPTSWNSKAKCKTHTWYRGEKDAGWNAELAIPLISITTDMPSSGTHWKANFCRQAKAANEISSWTQTNGTFHDAAIFGTLEFQDHVPAIRGLAKITAAPDGYVNFGFHSDAPVCPEWLARFNTGENVSLIPTNAVQGSMNQRMSLSRRNQCYRFSANPNVQGTETFLRTDAVSVRPNASYTVTARFQTDYKHTDEYPFLWFRQKQGGYRSLGLHFPKRTHGQWKTIRGKFVNGIDDIAELWAIKWDKALTGTIKLDDISVIDDQTGQELFPNGTFTRGMTGWNIFTDDNLIPSYGNGADFVRLRYSFKTPEGNLICRSPDYKLPMLDEFSAIKSTVVLFGADGLIYPDCLHLAAGAPERMNLLLTSDRRETIDHADVILRLPQEVRLLQPPAITLSPVPMSIREQPQTHDGHPYRNYILTIRPDTINSHDTERKLLGLIPLCLIADTPLRGTIPPAQYQAIINGKLQEPTPHRLALKILDAPVGKQASPQLPATLWIYPSTAETDSFTTEQRRLFNRKIADSGFNMVHAKASLVSDFKRLNINTFHFLSPLCCAGPYYFPGVVAFLRENPQYAGISAYGNPRLAIDPAWLTAKENVFQSHMEHVITQWLKAWPDEIHIDFEFPPLPPPGQKLPSPNDVQDIAFSKKNIELFCNTYQMPKSLTPTVILDKYRDKWLDFRNSQNAEVFKIIADIVHRQKPNARFSLYSGYPPTAENYYGVDWKKAAPVVDLVCAGYGGNDNLLLQSIPQPFFNSSLLLMNHMDGHVFANKFTSMLVSSGSFMGFVYYTVDGAFFRGVSLAAAIAADFEPIFRNLKQTRNNALTVAADTGKPLGNVHTFRQDETTLVVITNNLDNPATYKLKTTVSPNQVAIHYSTKRPIPHDKGRYDVTVKGKEPDAVVFVPKEACQARIQAPVPRMPEPASYPILRWKGNRQPLEHYEIRYATDLHALANAKIHNACEPNFQMPEQLPEGVAYFQVRAMNGINHPSPWSKPQKMTVITHKPLDYQWNATACGSLSDVGIWQYFSWGGGDGLATCSIDFKETFQDKAALRIDNAFETTESYWTLMRTNGCHGAIRDVQPGDTYIISGMIKTKGDIHGGLSLCAMRKDGSVIKRDSVSVSKATTWTPATARMTMPPGTRFLNCYFGGGSGQGSAWLSKVKLEKRTGETQP